MTLETRIGGIEPFRGLPAAAPRPALSADRFDAIAAAADISALAQIRTSEAFVRRFDPEQSDSGLSLDLDRKAFTGAIRICHGCSAQSGLFDQRCFNCGANLASPTQQTADTARQAALAEETWRAAVRAGEVPEARFARVLEQVDRPGRPWRFARALLAARFGG